MLTAWTSSEQREPTSNNYYSEQVNPWGTRENLSRLLPLKQERTKKNYWQKPNLEAVEKRSRGHEKSRSEQSSKCRASPRSRRWPLRPACSSGLIITLCGRAPVVAHSCVCCELCCSSVERRRLCLQAWRSDLGAGQNDYTKLYRFYLKV